MVFSGEYASRYVVLDVGKLFYYKDNNVGATTNNEMELKGEIDLKKFSLQPIDEKQVHNMNIKHKFICVRTASFLDITYHLILILLIHYLGISCLFT